MATPLETASLRVSRSTILLYAAITDDFNPIHVDPEFAAQTPMKGIIAHGMLSLNLIWQSLRRSLGLDAVGRIVLEIRFIRPVRENDVVTAGGERDADGRCTVWVRNQAGETVIAGHAGPRPEAEMVR